MTEGDLYWGEGSRNRLVLSLDKAMADPPESPLGELERQQLAITASRLESEEKLAATLTKEFVRNIISLAAAVMTFGVTAASVLKPFHFTWVLAAAWVSLLGTVIVGLLLQRHKLLNKEAEKYGDEEAKKYKKFFSYEVWLIVLFGVGLFLMTVFGILNL